MTILTVDVDEEQFILSVYSKGQYKAVLLRLKRSYEIQMIKTTIIESTVGCSCASGSGSLPVELNNLHYTRTCSSISFFILNAK